MESNRKGPLIEGDLCLVAMDEVSCEQVRLWRNQTSVATGFLDQRHITAEQQQVWYKRYKEKDDEEMFMICWQNQMVGALALYGINHAEKKAEFGRMMIGEESARGKGIAKKAIQLICQYGFEVLELETIELEVFETNTVAYKLYERVGFVEQRRYIKNGCRLCVMYFHKNAKE
ncbi:MAG: GNAT family N-acetyltransferase [Cellulosilyticaceae bacterium]